MLAQSYHSQVVERLKELGYAARAGEVKIKLAREFGFCYGVDRAVEYAYEAREQFPDRRIFLSGEIIHNPEVNGRIEGLGIRILPDHKSPEERYAEVDKADVVILPAFGVSVAELHAPARQGLRAGRHHLRQRAQRLEERPPLRARRLHGGDPRQALPRGDEGDRLAGAHAPRRALPVREGPRRGRARVRLHPRHGRGAGARRALPRGDEPGLRPGARPRAHRAREPDHDADDREPGDPGDAAGRDARALGRGRARRRASAPSTRSARRRRIARTPC